MIITYDTLAEAFYFQIKPEGEISKTLELDANTYLDVDEHGAVVGVEFLHPSPTRLKRVAQKYHLPELARVNPEKLQAALCS